MFGQWISNYQWKEIYDAETAHQKANIFQDILLEKYYHYFPEKSIKIFPDDKPWITSGIKSLDRRRKREWRKRGKSLKFKEINNLYMKISKNEKKKYSEKIVNNLKSSNPSQWYSKIKRMSSHGQKDEVVVQELAGLPVEEQVENIADKFSEISNLYNPLKREDIAFQQISNKKDPPRVEPYDILRQIKKSKMKASTVTGDIPMKLIKAVDVFICEPLSNILKRSLSHGEYPDKWKVEYVTPVPKVHPTQSIKQLRKISGTLNFSKLYEKILCEVMLIDMKNHKDPSQYGNEKGVGIHHYLVNMIDRILTLLDKNNVSEAYGIIVHLCDWSNAFDRQCPKLALQSFVNNNVRESVISVLVSYFQDRKMIVKWKNTLSSVRPLPGGAPQGCPMGQESYNSQTSQNADFVDPQDRYKWIDDLSLLEIINLIVSGTSSYNFKHHVASDVGIDQKYLPSQNIHSQDYADKISQWTQQNQMKLNEDKSKLIIFNFTKNYQFSTRVYLNNTLLEIVNETKILGLIISSDLSWHKNTENLVSKGYQRMLILRKLYEFSLPSEDLVKIYILYIRSILEFNSNVWFSSITQEEEDDLERVQRVACHIILNCEYENYSKSLITLKLENLKTRRSKTCTQFCQKGDK